MKSVGWEIRPLGWIVLVVILGLVIYFTIRWLRRPPSKGEERI
jgi:hypothetical protein